MRDKTNSNSKKLRNKKNSVEVVDIFDRPIANMDITEVHRQSLNHRSVIVLLYDSEGKLYLQKRSANKQRYPGRWDVSTGGHVFAKESRRDAALRVLNSDLKLQNSNLKKIAEIQASFDTGNEFITIFIVDKVNNLPDPNPEEVELGYFYSASELDWLIRECRELLAPTLVFLDDLQMFYRMK